MAFYSDKHSIFRVNSKDAVGGDGITQFGRALSALNIDIICANSPQAKGRVERAFGTLQDRLVESETECGTAKAHGPDGRFGAWLTSMFQNYALCSHMTAAPCGRNGSS